MGHNVQKQYNNVNIIAYLLSLTIVLGLFFSNPLTAQRKDQAVMIPENHLELVEFYATPVQNGVELAWATNLTLEGEFFSIERAGADGIFYSLTKIPAMGESRGTKYYRYLDDKVEEETSYYRITKIDTEGELYTSSVVVAHYELIEGLIMGPNPVINQLNLTFRLNDTEDPNLRIRIMDQQGNMVWNQTQVVSPKATQQFQLDLSNFKAGFYLLRLEQGSYAITRKFVKY